MSSCTPGIRVLCIYRSTRCRYHSVSKTLREDIQCQQVVMMARPGKECCCHQRPARTPARASARYLPHVGVGSAIPANEGQGCLKDDCVCNKRNGKDRVIGAMQLRRTCFHRIHGARAPETMVALRDLRRTRLRYLREQYAQSVAILHKANNKDD